jgi:subtilase family serine protease
LIYNMKKLLVLFSILLLVRQADAQTKYYLSPVKIDQMVSVSLPNGSVKLDTLGQQTISAKGAYGSMLVIRAANTKGEPVKNESGLDEVFKTYIQTLQKSLPDGEVLNAHDTTINKLKAYSFTLQIDSGSGIQSRRFVLLYTKNVSYTFEYLYDDFRKDLAAGEGKAFFNSIRVSEDLTKASQYITVSADRFTPLIKIIIAAIILAIIIGVIVIIRRRPQFG